MFLVIIVNNFLVDVVIFVFDVELIMFDDMCNDVENK